MKTPFIHLIRYSRLSCIIFLYVPLLVSLFLFSPSGLACQGEAALYLVVFREKNAAHQLIAIRKEAGPQQPKASRSLSRTSCTWPTASGFDQGLVLGLPPSESYSTRATSTSLLVSSKTTSRADTTD